MSAKLDPGATIELTLESFPWDPPNERMSDRLLTKAEGDLHKNFMMVLNSGVLPDNAETQPGAWLFAIMETWRTEAGRDGRKGHVKDEEIAEKLKILPGEKGYDRNRFQLEFGKGKIIRGYKTENGKKVDFRYQKPVNKNVAIKIIELALKNWDIRIEGPVDTKGTSRWDFCRSFPGLSEDEIRKIAFLSGNLIFSRHDLDIYCRPAVGLGPKTLLRRLGVGGYSLAIVAHDGEAVRLDNPDTQLYTFAEILNLLLCKGLGPSLGSINLWLLEHPDSGSNEQEPSTAMEPSLRLTRLRRIEHLRYLLKTLRWAQKSITVMADAEIREAVIGAGNTASPFPEVPLNRCFVAIYKAKDKLERNKGPFKKRSPEKWANFGVPEESEKYITMYASNPEPSSKFYIFPYEREASLTPYIEIDDEGYGEYLNRLISFAKNVALNISKSGNYDYKNDQYNKQPVQCVIMTVDDFIDQYSVSE